MTYKIVRIFRDSDRMGGRRRTLATNLSLEEARAHCRDPETASRTCTSAAGRARTRRLGAWFDAYEKE